ncbi:MAG: addiction module protein [Candidatus Hydrogenedentes bacterium]|nr:addiction module protein [Candidatus Hydrogenedentota bacterium]
MHSTKEIIEEAATLPVEERAFVVDALLRTLIVPDPEIDRSWCETARVRLKELRSGRVKPIPGNEVLSLVTEHFAR